MSTESLEGSGGVLAGEDDLIRVGGGEPCNEDLCGASVVGRVDEDGNTQEVRYEGGDPCCPYGHRAYVRERAKAATLKMAAWWRENPGQELVVLEVGAPDWVTPRSLNRHEGKAQRVAKEDGGVVAGYSFRDWFDEAGEEEDPSYHVVGFRRPGEGETGDVSSGWRVSEVATVEAGDGDVVEELSLLNWFEYGLRRVTFHPVEDGAVPDRYRHFGDLATYSGDPGGELEQAVEEAYEAHFGTGDGGGSVGEEDTKHSEDDGGEMVPIWGDEAIELIRDGVTDWDFDHWRVVFVWRQLLTGEVSIPDEYAGRIKREPPPGTDYEVQGDVSARVVVEELASDELSQRERWVVFTAWLDDLSGKCERGIVPESTLIEVLELWEIQPERVQGEDGLLRKALERGEAERTSVEGERGWRPL